MNFQWINKELSKILLKLIYFEPVVEISILNFSNIFIMKYLEDFQVGSGYEVCIIFYKSIKLCNCKKQKNDKFYKKK